MKMVRVPSSIYVVHLLHRAMIVAVVEAAQTTRKSADHAKFGIPTGS